MKIKIELDLEKMTDISPDERDNSIREAIDYLEANDYPPDTPVPIYTLETLQDDRPAFGSAWVEA